MENIKEEWRAVPGYYGLYEVSSLGRVKSLARKREGDGKLIPERIIEGNTSLPYKRCFLSKDGKTKTYYIHRLVAFAFLGNYTEDGLEVAHNNGNPLDNRVENLRWTTSKDNAADKVKHGTINKGVRHGCAKLTEMDVKVARFLRSEGFTLQAIADKLNISNSHTYQIVSGSRWSHI